MTAFAVLLALALPTHAATLHWARQSSHADHVQHTSGPWTVALDKDTAAISIQRLYDDGTVQLVWESVPGEAFVGCSYIYDPLGSVSGDVQQFGGDFKLVEHSTIDSHLQTIESVTSAKLEQADQEVINISGQLELRKYPYLLSNFKVGYNLSIYVDDSIESHLHLDVHLMSPGDVPNLNSNVPIKYLWTTFASDRAEVFYGFGHQYSYIDMKGRKVPILTREQGNGRGLQPITFLQNLVGYGGGSWDTTYAAIPQFVSSRKRSVFLQNFDLSFFDLTREDAVKISVDSFSLLSRITSGKSMLDVIESYTLYSGRMKPLPEWITNGSVVGMEGGRSFVESTLESLKAFDTPVAAFWLQDWVGLRDAPWGKALWWNWESDNESYPNWLEFIANMRKQGIRVMNYVNPMFANVNGSKPFRRLLYDEVKSNGYAVKLNDGSLESIYVQALLLDIFNPEAREWMKQLIIGSVLQGGISGYMCDFGEAYSFDAVHSSSDFDTPGAFHNAYAERWMMLNKEIADELDEDIVFFARSGFTRTPQYVPLMWLGDQMVTWDEYDGIKSSVVALLQSGFSGFSLEHTDIGGYQAVTQMSFNYVRTKELFLRWCELSAFSAVFRTHPGSDPTVNWQFYSDNETLQYFSYFSKMYVAWKDYRAVLMQEAWEKGYPVARHVALHYPDDENVYSLKYQFMIGSEWILAPVLDSEVDSVEIYLPADTFIHAWTGLTYTGPGWFSIETPLGKPCLMYKSDSTTGPAFVQRFKELITGTALELLLVSHGSSSLA